MAEIAEVGQASSANNRVRMILLDTDVFSLLELPDSQEYVRLRSRIAQLDPPQPVATTVITYEEQSRGRLASVSAARPDQRLTQAYFYLRQHILNYRQIPVVEFDEAAAAIATGLQRAKLHLGTMDIRIAAIAMAHGEILLSRNLRHFQRIPDLRVEDWTKP
jgi:tRNA(fMet)-specific endonuclease VapC